jgi:hypothetical protein
MTKNGIVCRIRQRNPLAGLVVTALSTDDYDGDEPADENR